eukprot:12935515-Prorocentrum_lima.AAC.1
MMHRAGCWTCRRVLRLSATGGVFEGPTNRTCTSLLTISVQESPNQSPIEGKSEGSPLIVQGTIVAGSQLQQQYK